MLGRNRSSLQTWTSVYVCERERERECVCVCVKCWGWKGRGYKCWSSMGKTLAITSSPSYIPPLNHHPPLPLVEAAHAVSQHAAWRQILTTERRYDAFELRPETEEAHADKSRCHWLFTEVLRTVDSGGVSKRNFFLAIKKKKKKKKKAEFRRKAEDWHPWVCIYVWSYQMPAFPTACPDQIEYHQIFC